MSNLSDEGLIGRFLNGDKRAFEHLVRRHQRDVYRLSLRLTGRHEDADDLAQEAFLRAYLGLKDFRGGSTFKTWMYRIVVNLSINRGKRVAKDRVRTLPLEEARAGAPSKVLDDMVRREARSGLKEAVGHLPARQRETLVLRLYKEMKFVDIAGVMNCTVGTAKANFFHAVANLKKAMTG